MQTKPKRIPELDGLRGIAIVLVLVWHYFVEIKGNESNETVHFMKTLFFNSWSGVDLFFVLSGFLIGGILIDHKGSKNYFKAFYTRRAFRILPIYMFLVALVWSCSVNLDWSDTPALKTLFANSFSLWSFPFFLQNFFMAASGFGAISLGITWSLAIEEQFYLVLPLVILFVNKRRLPFFCLLFVAMAPVIRSLVALNEIGKVSFFVLLPCRMDSLLLGVLGAWIYRRPSMMERMKENIAYLYAALGVFGAGILVFSIAQIGNGTLAMLSFGYTWIALSYLLLIFVCLLTKNRVVKTIATLWPLRLLGYISYFVYLFHQLVHGIVHYIICDAIPNHGDLAGLGATAISIAATFILGSISYFFLEQPMVKHGRKTQF
jgi:peptidoglycan/LPS O-acetylase OafA/YrhL